MAPLKESYMIQAEDKMYPDIMTYLRTEYERRTIPEQDIIIHHENGQRKKWVLGRGALDYVVNALTSGFPGEAKELAEWSARVAKAWEIK
jgi:hypothetical protein